MFGSWHVFMQSPLHNEHTHTEFRALPWCSFSCWLGVKHQFTPTTLVDINWCLKCLTTGYWVISHSLTFCIASRCPERDLLRWWNFAPHTIASHLLSNTFSSRWNSVSNLVGVVLIYSSYIPICLHPIPDVVIHCFVLGSCSRLVAFRVLLVVFSWWQRFGFLFQDPGLLFFVLLSHQNLFGWK